MTAPHHLRLQVPGCGAVSALAQSPADAQAVYVFAHGAGAGMDHAFMARVAAGLAERRVACLRYQFPYMEAGSRRVDAPAIAHAAVCAAVAHAGQAWPGLPLYAGGKSFGGRMTSQAQAAGLLGGVAGLIFLGFPLHPAGKPSTDRAVHLHDVDVPMLFLHGTRDVLAEAEPFDAVTRQLRPAGTFVDVAGADHSFGVLRKSGRTDAEVLEDVLDWMVVWMQAGGIVPRTGS